MNDINRLQLITRRSAVSLIRKSTYSFLGGRRAHAHGMDAFKQRHFSKITQIAVANKLRTMIAKAFAN